jgi:hypothetical protein
VNIKYNSSHDFSAYVYISTIPIISGIVDSVLVEAQLLGSKAVSLGFLQLLLNLGWVFRYIS